MSFRVRWLPPLVLCCVLVLLLARRGETHADSCPVSTGPCADLSVTLFGPEDAPAGSEVEYDIVVQNNGPDASTDATLTQVLPAGAVLIAASPTQGTCDNAPLGVLTCALGTLNYPDTATVVVTAYLTIPGPNPSSVKITSTTFDPVLSNNVDSTTASLSAIPCPSGIPARIGSDLSAYARYQALPHGAAPCLPSPSPPPQPSATPPPQPSATPPPSQPAPPVDAIGDVISLPGPGCFKVVTPASLSPMTPVNPAIVNRVIPSSALVSIWQLSAAGTWEARYFSAALGPLQSNTVGPGQPIVLCVSGPATYIAAP